MFEFRHLAIAVATAVAAVCATASAAPAASASTSVTYASNLVKHGKPGTFTTRQKMPSDECAYLHQAHPRVACDIITTVHTDEPTKISQQTALRLLKGGPSATANAAAKTTWKRGSGWTELCGGSCHIWHSKASTTYIYNGRNRVWQQSIDCSDYAGIGYTVSVTWCGDWNNGGYRYYYMNMGDNFNVSWVYKGSPVHRGYWQRYNVSVNGSFWRCSSKGGSC